MKEKFNDDYGFSKLTIEEFIKTQNNFKKIIEMYNNDEMINDEEFLETIQDDRNFFESIFEDYETLLNEINPNIERY